MRGLLLAMAVLLLAANAAVASPSGGAVLLSLSWGEPGEPTDASTPVLTPDGVERVPTVLASFALPPDAQGVYLAISSFEAETAWVERGFAIHLTTPGGDDWAAASASTLSTGLCPAQEPCRWEFSDGAGPTTPLRPGEAGDYQVRIHGMTTGAYTLDVRTT